MTRSPPKLEVTALAIPHSRTTITTSISRKQIHNVAAINTPSIMKKRSLSKLTTYLSLKEKEKRSRESTRGNRPKPLCDIYPLVRHRSYSVEYVFASFSRTKLASFLRLGREREKRTVHRSFRFCVPPIPSSSSSCQCQARFPPRITRSQSSIHPL